MFRQGQLIWVALALMSAYLTAQTANVTNTNNGTANVVPVYTGSSTLGNSPIFISGTRVGIGSANPIAPFTIYGNYPVAVFGYEGTTANAPVTMGKLPFFQLIGQGNPNGTPNIGLLQLNMGAGGMTQAASEIYLGATFGTVASSRVAVQQGTLLGMVGFFGDDGTTVRTRAAFINSAVDTSHLPVSTGVVPGNLYLGTTSSAPIIFGTQVNQANLSQVGSNPPVTAERMRIDYNGNVGIGTAVPGAKLEVDGNVKLAPTNGASPSLSLVGAGANITFPDNSQQTTAWTGVLCGGDYAEAVNVIGGKKSYEPGDVLVLASDSNGNVEKSHAPYSTMVAGIYATKPGVIGRRQSLVKDEDELPMAMVGVVPTKVSAESGPIKQGDLLVTSSRPGYAMKGTDRSRMLGAVIGKAMGSIDSGIGVIEVLVTLQ